MDHYVIIVAGGSGKRMNSSLPKQFIEINQKPIIFHTIEKFLAFDLSIHIVVALQEDYITLFEELYKKHKYSFPYTMTKAGAERFNTVKNALEKIPNQGLVAIHDAVRPLVSVNTIKKTFESAKNNQASIPVTNMVSSIRLVNENYSESLDRSKYKIVQTPQCFNNKKIKEAYFTNYSSKFTDDASVYEDQIGAVYLVGGNEENIKITTPKDLIIAEYLLS